MAGRLPGAVAAVEPAHGTIDERARLGRGEGGEHAILGREHQRAAWRDLGERQREPRADCEPGTRDVGLAVVAAEREIDDGGVVARHERRKSRAVDAQLGGRRGAEDCRRRPARSRRQPRPARTRPSSPSAAARRRSSRRAPRRRRRERHGRRACPHTGRSPAPAVRRAPRGRPQRARPRTRPDRARRGHKASAHDPRAGARAPGDRCA